MTTVTATARHSALERIREAERFAVRLPLVGHIGIPHPEQLAYLAGLGILVAVEILDWPVAAAIAAGHLLAEERHHRVLQGIGEALEEV